MHLRHLTKHLGRRADDPSDAVAFRDLDGYLQARLDTGRDLFEVGFHSYRHSFASNLAAAGVDQRVIDEFMGHTTEATRKRYRHPFPRNKRAAIESFSPAAG